MKLIRTFRGPVYSLWGAYECVCTTEFYALLPQKKETKEVQCTECGATAEVIKLSDSAWPPPGGYKVTDKEREDDES